QIGGAFGEEVAVGGFALAVEQAAAGGVEVEQELAVVRIAHQAAYPARGGQPAAAADGGDAMQRGGGRADEAAGGAPESTPPRPPIRAPAARRGRPPAATEKGGRPPRSAPRLSAHRRRACHRHGPARSARTGDR